MSLSHLNDPARHDRQASPSLSPYCSIGKDVPSQQRVPLPVTTTATIIAITATATATATAIITITATTIITITSNFCYYHTCHMHPCSQAAVQGMKSPPAGSTADSSAASWAASTGVSIPSPAPTSTLGTTCAAASGSAMPA